VAAAMAACGSDQPPAWLGAEERQRYRSFTNAGRRQQFVAGRYWARRALAAHAGGDWREYILSAPAEGAPLVLSAAPHAAMPNAALHFSLSHSRDWLACALSSQAIGIDIEDTRVSRDFDGLGALIYGEHEIAMLASKPTSARRTTFYRLWTLKEAWLKYSNSHYSMRQAQFAPCAARQAQAAVLTSSRWTLALVGFSPASTMVRAPELQSTPVEWWRIIDSPRDS
jgi:4'-phosphopantetheinyl transferase